MEERFLEFVAEIMEVDRNGIGMDTRYNEFERWNSLMMLSLVMELEQEYDVSIPIESLAKVKQLSDLYYLVKKF